MAKQAHAKNEAAGCPINRVVSQGIVREAETEVYREEARVVQETVANSKLEQLAALAEHDMVDAVVRTRETVGPNTLPDSLEEFQELEEKLPNSPFSAAYLFILAKLTEFREGGLNTQHRVQQTTRQAKHVLHFSKLSHDFLLRSLHRDVLRKMQPHEIDKFIEKSVPAHKRQLAHRELLANPPIMVRNPSTALVVP